MTQKLELVMPKSQIINLRTCKWKNEEIINTKQLSFYYLDTTIFVHLYPKLDNI